MENGITQPASAVTLTAVFHNGRVCYCCVYIVPCAAGVAEMHIIATTFVFPSFRRNIPKNVPSPQLYIKRRRCVRRRRPVPFSRTRNYGIQIILYTAQTAKIYTCSVFRPRIVAKQFATTMILLYRISTKTSFTVPLR